MHFLKACSQHLHCSIHTLLTITLEQQKLTTLFLYQCFFFSAFAAADLAGFRSLSEWACLIRVSHGALVIAIKSDPDWISRLWLTPLHKLCEGANCSDEFRSGSGLIAIKSVHVTLVLKMCPSGILVKDFALLIKQYKCHHNLWIVLPAISQFHTTPSFKSFKTFSPIELYSHNSMQQK